MAIIKKLEYVKQLTEVIEDIRCDICKKQILKEGDVVDFAIVMKYKARTEHIKEGVFSNFIERETSDLCFVCYGKVLDYMKSLGAKVPSFFDSGDEDGEDVRWMI